MTGTQGPVPKQAKRPGGKFPVFRTSWAACLFLVRNWCGFAIAALVPLLLSLALDLWLGDWTESSETRLSVVSLVHSIPQTLFSVAWYQFYLAGPTRAAPRWIPSWTSRYWRFLGYTLAFNVLYAATGVPLWYWENPIVLGIVLAVLVLVLYVTTRLSLIFPAISIGQSYGFGRSWRLTIGNGWRILLACMLPTLLMIIWAFLVGFTAFYCLDAVLESGVDATDFGDADTSIGWAFVIVQALIWQSMGYVVLGVCVVVTSIAYRFCTALPQPATGPGVEA
jgi:hypothetical protein